MGCPQDPGEQRRRQEGVTKLKSHYLNRKKEKSTSASFYYFFLFPKI
ncbi:unnamed protein product [Brassica oleracea]|uniref:(rape) hypothetical protein n=1 Tax=Brassica napus TaxID=3708 RepID=A0A816L3S1_BRANA|nr:unnamed protein product [Brassica napus]